jgi:hypothetical protein
MSTRAFAQREMYRCAHFVIAAMRAAGLAGDHFLRFQAGAHRLVAVEPFGLQLRFPDPALQQAGYFSVAGPFLQPETGAVEAAVEPQPGPAFGIGEETAAVAAVVAQRQVHRSHVVQPALEITDPFQVGRLFKQAQQGGVGGGGGRRRSRFNVGQLLLAGQRPVQKEGGQQESGQRKMFCEGRSKAHQAAMD